MNTISKQTSDFEEAIFAELDLPLALEIKRFDVSSIICGISFDFWRGTRLMLDTRMITPAATLLRSQFESIVRSIWILNNATNEVIDKLSADLSPESEQAAKNLPTVNEMMPILEKSIHPNAFAPLNEFKHYSWRALNSHTHSGIHAVARGRSDSPDEINNAVYRLSNGLAVTAAMHYVILCGRQDLQKRIISISLDFPECFIIKQQNAT